MTDFFYNLFYSAPNFDDEPLPLVVEPSPRGSKSAYSNIYKKTHRKGGSFCKWRIGRDSNPRYPLEVHTISNRAPSTTRPPIRKTVLKLYYSNPFCNKFFLKNVNFTHLL